VPRTCRWSAPWRRRSCYAINSQCGSRLEHRAEQRGRAGFVERFVSVAALWRLHTRRATGDTRTGGDDVECRGEMAIGRGESEFGDAGAAGLAVVDEHRGRVGVLLVCVRHAAYVPSTTDCEERQQ